MGKDRDLEAISDSSMLLSADPGETDDDAIALFFDSTETAYRIADHLHRKDPNSFVRPPAREFVIDADDAHERLLSGRNPIVGMSLDDVLSLVNRSGARAGELVVVAGVSAGFLKLIAAPELGAVDQLRCKKVAIDTDTGYARALFSILDSAGLRRDADYSVVYAGATNIRYEKLVANEFDATLLGAPFTDLAMARGYRALGSVRDELGSYQAIVLVALRSSLPQNEDVVRTALSSLIGAQRWAMASENRDELLTVISEVVPGLTGGEVVAAVTETLFGDDSEYQTDGRLSDRGIATVVDLYNRTQNDTLAVESVLDLIDYAYLPRGRRWRGLPNPAR